MCFCFWVAFHWVNRCSAASGSVLTGVVVASGVSLANRCRVFSSVSVGTEKMRAVSFSC